MGKYSVIRTRTNKFFENKGRFQKVTNKSVQICVSLFFTEQPTLFSGFLGHPPTNHVMSRKTKKGSVVFNNCSNNFFEIQQLQTNQKITKITIFTEFNHHNLII